MKSQNKDKKISLALLLLVILILAPAASACWFKGVKFYDADADGIKDPGEVGIPGWKIEAFRYSGSTWVPSGTTWTGLNGSYSLHVDYAGVYRVVEHMPQGCWLQTFPAPPGCHLIDATGGGTFINKDFGNVCLEAGHGGLTPGSWSSRNRQALITPGDIAALNALNLYIPPGWGYPPFVNAEQIRNYLLSATAKDMRWMLSAQLIATKLTVLHSFLNAATIVYVGPSSYVPSGFISIGGIMNNANAALLLPHPENRNKQEYWKNLLNGLNNNSLPFVCPAPCLPIVYP